MTMHIKDGSGNFKEVIGLYIKRNDALEEVLSGYVRQNAEAKQFYGSGGGGPTGLTIDPASLNANYGEFDAPQTVFFDAIAGFGTGPYTYVWDFINVNSGPGYVGAPTITSGQGTANIAVEFSGNTDATLRVTVTDSLLVEEIEAAVLSVFFGTPP